MFKQNLAKLLIGLIVFQLGLTSISNNTFLFLQPKATLTHSPCTAKSSTQSTTTKTCQQANAMNALKSETLSFAFFMRAAAIYDFNRVLFYPLIFYSIFKPPQM